MQKLNKNHYAIIMAGGIGSRFWPWSKKSFPKQFLDIMGTGQTLLQLTYSRFKNIVPQENIYIISNEVYTPLIQEQLPEINSDNIIKEPQAMNTAPCVLYATSKIHAKNKDAVCVFAPSDHLILKEKTFIDTTIAGLEFAEKENTLVTIGITPNRPDTGYGYIQFLTNKQNQFAHKVKTFTEKPDLELAQTFIESGDFLWNAGIFIWASKTILNAFEIFQPDLFKLFKDGNKFYNSNEEQDYIRKIYPQTKNISIDYAIMEKADNVCVIPADLGWSDLGTWKSLFEVREKTMENNVIHGDKILVMDTKNSLVLNQEKEKVVVVNGLKNMMVINTEDALLICELNREQEVKLIVNEIKNRYKDKFS
ncbi:MAG: mannose-1-phosphate guanylyltransferase [Bacteroidetes bacterium]|nr:mannose-1-phosphate guanylyltransferase [Bacteroidota bacterium]